MTPDQVARRRAGDGFAEHLDAAGQVRPASGLLDLLAAYWVTGEIRFSWGRRSQEHPRRSAGSPANGWTSPRRRRTSRGCVTSWPQGTRTITAVPEHGTRRRTEPCVSR